MSEALTPHEVHLTYGDLEQIIRSLASAAHQFDALATQPVLQLAAPALSQQAAAGANTIRNTVAPLLNIIGELGLPAPGSPRALAADAPVAFTLQRLPLQLIGECLAATVQSWEAWLVPIPGLMPGILPDRDQVQQQLKVAGEVAGTFLAALATAGVPSKLAYFG